MPSGPGYIIIISRRRKCGQYIILFPPKNTAGSRDYIVTGYSHLVITAQCLLMCRLVWLYIANALFSEKHTRTREHARMEILPTRMLTRGWLAGFGSVMYIIIKILFYVAHSSLKKVTKNTIFACTVSMSRIQSGKEHYLFIIGIPTIHLTPSIIHCHLISCSIF